MSNGTFIIDEIHATYVSDHRIPHPAEIAIAEREGMVTLRGTVGSLRQHQAAVENAKSVGGVRAVEDELVIDPRDRWEDAEIRGAALRAVISRGGSLADRVDVTVANGWLTLKGEVKHQYDSDAAFEAVSGLAGVGGITNKITVITAGIS